MKKHVISDKTIRQFGDYLMESEKSEATVKKYLREIDALKNYMAGEAVAKGRLLDYRRFLHEKNRAATVNVKLSAINNYLQYYRLADCTVKFLKIQRNAFVNEEKELTQQEYRRLLEAAAEKHKHRLYHLILTICSTGIRVSEVQFITAEAVKQGKAEINMKGKNRVVILPKKLVQKLENFMKEHGIFNGPVFRTRSGRTMDRSNICHEMKKLGERAGICRKKVHPHSLRHLFARQYYSVHRNIAHLADVLGHSSIETTRIYVAVSAREHEQTMETMNLII